MIHYNFERILKARGVDKPFSYLKKAGFSDNFATKIKNNKVVVLRLKELEKLCTLLRCTPNDFYEWTPDSNTDIDKEHPLHAIRKSDKVVDLTKTLNSIPLGKLDEIEQMIKVQIKATVPNNG
jgi:DNA-binding Xre family transcriptional regulator